MPRYIDLSNKKYGRLSVQQRIGINKHGSMMWLCKCDCGNFKKISTSHLRSGSTKSCGCLDKETKTTCLGLSKTRIHTIYRNINIRCSDPNSRDYKNYGGRGIKNLWDSFEGFYEDMKDGYAENLTIDRIDNDSHYCKENCHWATKEQQANNTRRNVLLTHKGKTQTVAQWARELGVDYFFLRQRKKRGWSDEKILTTPAFNRGQNI